jgi:hypothetical protein
MKMNAFWASVLLSFVVSVTANLIHNPLILLIGRWRLSSQRKQYAREAEYHQLLSDLKTGKVDKYIYLTRICATMVMGFLGSQICLVGGILLTYTSDRPEAVIMRFVLGAGSGGLMSFYVLAAARHQALVWGLHNFEKLDAEFKQKHGEQTKEDGAS